ncbi:MAG: MFS transporter [Pseudomonas sp.]
MLTPVINITHAQAFFFCLVLSLFELLTYIASDIVMPSMLSVTRDLDASPDYIPYALNLYLLGGVILQWLIGPLSDRFGRRPLLLFGCAGFTLTCLATYWVTDIYLFNGLRLLQGIGLGFVIAVSYPALNEAFSETDAVRVMALLANIALISPLLGPLLGTLLLEWVSWRSLFLIIGAGGVLVWLGLYRFMPETLGVKRRDGSNLEFQPLLLRPLLSGYRALLGNGQFMAGCVALGLIGLPLIAWIGLSPLLLIHGQGLSTLAYALWQLPVFGGLIVGNLLINRVASKYGLRVLIRRALWPLLGGLSTMMIGSQFYPSVMVVVSGLSLYAVGLGFSNAVLYRITLFASDQSKGLVSAMLGTITVALFGLGGSILAVLGTGESLTAFALTGGAAGFLALWPLHRVLTEPAITTDTTLPNHPTEKDTR